MRVIIVEDDPITRLDLRKLLEHAGVEVVGEGKDGIDAITLCRSCRPDVAVLDVNMPTLDGLGAAKIINRDRSSAAIVLLTAYSDPEYLEAAKAAGVQGYLVKPLNNARSLISTLEVALASAAKAEKIQQKLDTMAQKLEDRKYIDKAKGFLMRTEGLTEEDAYGKIRTLSMEKNCSMRDISEILLLQ